MFDVSHYLFYLTHSALNGSNREIKLGVISVKLGVSPHPHPPVPACWVVGRVLLKFYDNHTKSVVGRVLLKFLLVIKPKARIILVIFRGKHRKNDAELFLTITVRFTVGPTILAETDQVKTETGLVCYEMDQFLSKY